MSDPTTEPLDLDAIEARADAATPGPWERGEVWAWADVMADRFGPNTCGLCAAYGEPVWTGEVDINGRMMDAHKHRATDPYEPDHVISGPDGVVAGNYDHEDGGIFDPADTEFVVHARSDVPALAAEVRRLRGELSLIRPDAESYWTLLKVLAQAVPEPEHGSLEAVWQLRHERDAARAEAERLGADLDEGLIMLAQARDVEAFLAECRCDPPARVLDPPCNHWVAAMLARQHATMPEANDG